MDIRKAIDKGAKMEKKSDTNVVVFQKIFELLDNTMAKMEDLTKQLDGDDAAYAGKIVSDLMDWVQEVGTTIEQSEDSEEDNGRHTV